MSALLNVVPIDSKTAKPRCAFCIRDVDGDVVSPCKTHRRKYDGNAFVAMSADQLTAFLDAAQSDVRSNALFRVMFCHGLRVQEIARLRLSDVNFQENTIRIIPLKKKRKMAYLEPLVPGEKEGLLAYLAARPDVGADAPLFISRKHVTKVQPLHRSHILKLYVKIAQRAGLPARLWHPHVMKHTLAMRMYERMVETNSVDAPTIQFALRHSSPASTSVYMKPTAQSVAISKTNLFGSLLAAR
jgi:integrase